MASECLTLTTENVETPFGRHGKKPMKEVAPYVLATSVMGLRIYTVLLL